MVPGNRSQGLFRGDQKVRADLTDLQMRQLLAQIRPKLMPPEVEKIEKLMTELQALRERESVSRFLHEIEGAV